MRHKLHMILFRQYCKTNYTTIRGKIFYRLASII